MECDGARYRAFLTKKSLDKWVCAWLELGLDICIYICIYFFYEVEVDWWMLLLHAPMFVDRSRSGIDHFVFEGFLPMWDP